MVKDGEMSMIILLWLIVVQSQIKKGMAQAEVLEVLGSPNIVTKNSSGNEVWTYDKISSSQSSSNNASATYGQAQLGKGFWAFLFGGTTNSVQSSSNRDVESKSLTVIITFNNDKIVSDFTYQSLKYYVLLKCLPTLMVETTTTQGDLNQTN